MTTQQLKTGDTVKVFCKPITDEQEEGIARLVSKLHDAEGREPDDCERWSVRFFGPLMRLESEKVHRWVHARNLVATKCGPLRPTKKR